MIIDSLHEMVSIISILQELEVFRHTVIWQLMGVGGRKF
jgi:hypothetical protein